MVPVITEGGRSFKGAAAYFLHDKRQDGEAERLTAARVAWTEAINLPTDDPDRAWRMMAHTAMAQADLKAAAGVKATGRKLTKPVFAYSLAWHERDRPTREDQLAAARATLKELGLEGHQALIVCHNDTRHPHVHVIVNRVSPDNGIAASLSKSKERLQAWALKYQQERGQTHCPKREANAAKRRQGERPERTKRPPRPAYEFEKATSNDDLKTGFVQAQQKQADAHLHSIERAMKQSHGRQWDELKRVYAAARAKLYENSKRMQDRRAAQIKESYRPKWAALFKAQRQARTAFEDRESGIMSKLWNAAATFRELRRQDIEGDLMGTVFASLSGRERRNVLAAAQERERQGLARELGEEIGEAGATIRQETRRSADKLRNEFLSQCAHLRATQDQQRDDMATAWRTRNAERKAARAPSMDRAAARQRNRDFWGKDGRGRDEGRSRSAEERRPPGRDWRPS